MFDCHIHSNFSVDSTAPPEELCKAATERGLDGIIFTEHLDFDYTGYGDSLNTDFDAYMKYTSGICEEYKPVLKVLRGIEVGIQPHVIEKSLAVVKSYPFDYVLASVHIIDGVDPYAGAYYINKTKQEAYGLYLQKVLYMVKHFSDFDAAGHFDYIIRRATYDDRSLRYADHMDLMDSIFKELVHAGRGFEINTGSYREKPGSPVAEYDMNILKRYRELGGEIICLGSDSHKTDYVGYKFDYFTQLLKESGFKYIAHFEERKPVFEEI